jgi:transcriptional regulator with XRE-family HTH domain
MIDKKWFIAKLANRQQSQRALGRYMKLDASAITHILNGKRKLQLTEAEQMARFLGEPVDEVLRHAGVKVKGDTSRVPLLGAVDEVGSVMLLSQQTLVEAPATMSGLAALQLRSLSALDGVLLFFNPTNDYPPEIMQGKPAVVTLANSSLTVGILRRGMTQGKYSVMFIGHQLDEQEVKSASPILWIKP